MRSSRAQRARRLSRSRSRSASPSPRPLHDHRRGSRSGGRPHHRAAARSRSASPRSQPRTRRRQGTADALSALRSVSPAPASVLPAAAHREELLAAMRAHQTVVCVGETGSGKTTQIPQYVLHALEQQSLGTDPRGGNGRIVVTQPRRVAAVSVAQRVAEEMGFARLRDSPVGYTIRFDDQTTAATTLKFVTDGVLVRECLRDPTLAHYAVVVLDEAHERSLHTDILFGLLKRVLATRRDLRLLVTSATLDAERFAAFFGHNAVPCPIVSIPGRVFPVEIFHSKQPQIMGLRGPLSPYVRAAAETAMQLHSSEPQGHILVFLTGLHEIDDACAQLRRLNKERVKEGPMELLVLPLYGALSGHAQRAIFQSVPAHIRKVIVATNIAETSLTIDGVRFVVDSGFTKQKVYNPSTQLASLVVVPISKVSALQRAGRAGRTAPGKCFRLYSKTSYEEMLDESIPEIRRTNLANTVLYLKVLGVHDVLGFELLDRPEDDALLDALAQLFTLDALDDDGHVTSMGKLMAQFPLEPKLARALLEAVKLDCAEDMATIVAMLSVENVYTPPEKKRDGHEDDNGETPSRDELMLALAQDGLVDDRGDHLTYLRLLTTFEKLPPHERHEWCEIHELRSRSLSTATAIRRQLLEIISSLPPADVQELGGDPDMRKRSRSTRLRRALCAGFFSHAVRRCNAQSAVYRALDAEEIGSTRSNHVQLLHLHPLSTLNYVAPPTYCVYHELVVTSRPFVRHVVAVDETWVREYARGKNKISLAQLYALSGVENPSVQQTSKTTSTSTEERKRPIESDEATQNTTAADKQTSIDAARARFLARKKPHT